MKSKVTFDLDGQNKAIILAQVEFSDDVRDKIANRFKEALGSSSNLAIVSFWPAAYGEGAPINSLEVRPLPGTYEEVTQELTFISSEQMSMLIRNFSVELAKREVGVDWEHLKKEHDQIRDNIAYIREQLPEVKIVNS